MQKKVYFLKKKRFFLLVFIIITPHLALGPYNFSASAPLITVIDFISSGFGGDVKSMFYKIKILTKISHLIFRQTIYDLAY